MEISKKILFLLFFVQYLPRTTSFRTAIRLNTEHWASKRIAEQKKNQIDFFFDVPVLFPTCHSGLF